MNSEYTCLERHKIWLADTLIHIRKRTVWVSECAHLKTGFLVFIWAAPPRSPSSHCLRASMNRARHSMRRRRPCLKRCHGRTLGQSAVIRQQLASLRALHSAPNAREWRARKEDPCTVKRTSPAPTWHATTPLTSLGNHSSCRRAARENLRVRRGCCWFEGWFIRIILACYSLDGSFLWFDICHNVYTFSASDVERNSGLGIKFNKDVVYMIEWRRKMGDIAHFANFTTSILMGVV